MDALTSTDLRFLSFFHALETDPETANCRHLAGYIGLKTGLAPFEAQSAAERLSEAGIIERDADSVGLPLGRGSWRMRDLHAAERALGLTPSALSERLRLSALA